MRDVGDSFVSYSRLDPERNELLLNALAALHATFLGEHEALSSDRGFCSLSSYYTCLSETIARRESREPDDFPSLIARGWDVLEQALEPDVATLVRRLSEAP